MRKNKIIILKDTKERKDRILNLALKNEDACILVEEQKDKDFFLKKGIDSLKLFSLKERKKIKKQKIIMDNYFLWKKKEQVFFTFQEVKNEIFIFSDINFHFTFSQIKKMREIKQNKLNRSFDFFRFFTKDITSSEENISFYNKYYDCFLAEPYFEIIFNKNINLLIS